MLSKNLAILQQTYGLLLRILSPHKQFDGIQTMFCK